MYVSQESSVEVESRLLSLLQEAQWKFFQEPFSFAEFEGVPVSEHWSLSTVACITDGQVSSFLRPTEKDTEETFGLFSVHFPPDKDNSGFVGWLANRLKATCGTGVFVVCGSNSARGGIFDYWGYPLAVKDKVMSELERLGIDVTAEVTPPPDFEGRNFTVTSSDPHGEANSETNFRFRQHHDIVEADYQGGPIRTGKLIGTLHGNQLSYKYIQANVQGKVRTGQAITKVSRTASGKLRLEEHFKWDGQAEQSTGTLVLEEL